MVVSIGKRLIPTVGEPIFTQVVDGCVLCVKCIECGMDVKYGAHPKAGWSHADGISEGIIYICGGEECGERILVNKSKCHPTCAY